VKNGGDKMNGQFGTPIVERRSIPLLGERKRAEELVTWSLKFPVGTRWKANLPHGLTLGFVSDANEPKMYIHWNQQRFLRFLEKLGRQERFILISHGISCEHHAGKTLVKLLGAGKTSVILWDTVKQEFAQQHSKKDPNDDVNWLLGMVRFAEEGPLFLAEVECQQELEEATALAIVETGKKVLEKPVAEVLPEQRVSPAVTRFLVTDALMRLTTTGTSVPGGEQ
jgi:hypothetical protein